MRIKDNQMLANIPNFQRHKAVGGDLQICNSALTSISGSQNLNTVEGGMRI